MYYVSLLFSGRRVQVKGSKGQQRVWVYSLFLKLPGQQGCRCQLTSGSCCLTQSARPRWRSCLCHLPLRSHLHLCVIVFWVCMCSEELDGLGIGNRISEPVTKRPLVQNQSSCTSSQKALTFRELLSGLDEMSWWFQPKSPWTCVPITKPLCRCSCQKEHLVDIVNWKVKDWWCECADDSFLSPLAACFLGVGDMLLEQCWKCHPAAALAGPVLEVKAWHQTHGC